MNTTRRLFLKFSGALVSSGVVTQRLFAATSTLVREPPPINSITGSDESFPISTRSLPAGTLIISKNQASGDRLLVVNNSGDELTLREIVPNLVGVDGRVYDLNVALRQRPLVVPAHGVRSCRLQSLQQWQVYNADQVHDVRGAPIGSRLVVSIERNTQIGVAEHAEFQMVV